MFRYPLGETTQMFNRYANRVTDKFNQQKRLRGVDLIEESGVREDNSVSPLFPVRWSNQLPWGGG